MIHCCIAERKLGGPKSCTTFLIAFDNPTLSRKELAEFLRSNSKGLEKNVTPENIRDRLLKARRGIKKCIEDEIRRSRIRL